MKDVAEHVTRIGTPTGVSKESARLQRENDTLRGLLGNSAKPCAYCGLAAEDQAKCAHGFPGCMRADDQILSKHFADGYALEQTQKEIVAIRSRIAELADEFDRRGLEGVPLIRDLLGDPK